MSLTRTPRGWAVHSPAGVEQAGDLVEGLSLADLVAEELGALTEPDRTARRSARGAAEGTGTDDGVADLRVAALERTVAQLEHALAARVSTERAIGVLAERHGTSARTAFESLRRDARSQGRPVAELAREVLDGLAPEPTPAGARTEDPGASRRSVATATHSPSPVVAAIDALAPRPPTDPHGPVAAADDRS